MIHSLERAPSPFLVVTRARWTRSAALLLIAHEGAAHNIEWILTPVIHGAEAVMPSTICLRQSDSYSATDSHAILIRGHNDGGKGKGGVIRSASSIRMHNVSTDRRGGCMLHK